MELLSHFWRGTICLFCAVFGLNCSSSGGDIFLIARRENEAVCVSNSYLPLAWNTRRSLEKPENRDSFYEKVPNLLDCTVYPGNCRALSENSWNLTKSSEAPLSGYIPTALIDRRWQNIKEFHTVTGYSTFFDGDYFQKIRRFTMDHVELPISFRVGSEAQIFICASWSPLHIGDCYLILVQVDESSAKTSVKLCRNVRILLLRKVFPHKYCRDLEVNTTNINLNGKEWNHFDLQRHTGQISLLHITARHSNLVLKIKDEHIRETHDTVVLVNSGADGGLWRFHEYDFYYTTAEGTTVTFFASRLEPRNNAIYLSLFAAACQSCRIKYNLADVETGEEKPCRRTQVKVNGKRWNKINITAENVGRAVYLQITTEKMEAEATELIDFWAISNIQQRAYEPDYNRVYLYNVNASEDSCQQIFSDSLPNELSFHGHSYTILNNVTCPSDNSSRIGFCIPCELIFEDGDCSKVNVCARVEGLIECISPFTKSTIAPEVAPVPTVVPGVKRTKGPKEPHSDGGHRDKGGQRGDGGLYYLFIIPIIVLLLLILLAIIVYKKRRERLREIATKNKKADESMVYAMLPVKPEDMNMEECKIPERVDIAQFERYVYESDRTGELEKQLSTIIPENQQVYSEILATQNEYYEKPMGTVFIDGYKAAKAFLAIQDQDDITASIFWNRVYENNVENIALLSNDGNEKLISRFFPNIGSFILVDQLKVEGVLEKNCENYKYRIFRFQNDKLLREIKLFSFTKWTNHIPLCSQYLKELVTNLLALHLTPLSPILFMDSNGKDLTRIVAVVLSDSCLRMAAREGTVAVYRLFRRLFEKLPLSLHHFTDYTLVHHIVVEAIFHFNGEITCANLKAFGSEGRTLDLIRLQIRCVEIMMDTKKVVPTIEKHKIVNLVVPTYGNLAQLGAVYVNSFRTPKKFIVLKEPNLDAVDNFWRIALENDVSLIITLNQHNPEVWLNHVLVVGCLEENKTSKHLDSMVVQINSDSFLPSKKAPFALTILSLKHWPSSEDTPEDLRGFLSFWRETHVFCNYSPRVIVMCKDGITASGIYVTISFLLERMKVKRICDVSKAVTSVRQSNDQFIKKIQLSFLYEAAANYLNSEK